ncbi:MAG: glycoside hydrolase domain-containing protein [Ginsengibacter sp.]
MKNLYCCILLFFLLINARAQHTTGNYISTSSAIQQYADTIKNKNFIVFPEVRELPVQWRDSLRVSWLTNHYDTSPYVLHAQPGEYFVFQTGIWAIDHEMKNVTIRFSNFKNDGGTVIAANEITCFNRGGINYEGHAFTKQINIPSGEVRPLWIGINLPESAKGNYDGTVTVTCGSVSKTIKIQLELHGEVLNDHGFDEGRRLARLQWLNSTVGENEAITKGYIPVERKGNLIKIVGRSMEIAGDGLPGKITSYFTASNQSIDGYGEPVIDTPFRFIIEKTDGTIIHLRPGKLQFTSQSPSMLTWEIINTSDACNVICHGRLEYDGFVNYQLTVKAKELLRVKDIRMEVNMNKNKAIYMMGLNKPGGLRPARWDWKWDTTKNQDALWLGGVNGGLRIKWKADNYAAPLVNVYYEFGRLHLPASWGNDDKGGVQVSEKKNGVIVNAFSGSRVMLKGEEQHYDFDLLITPFRTMDKAVQFGARYYHSGTNASTDFIHEADSLGANIINVHQGNDLYPFINYPYSDVNVDALKNFITEVHNDHKRVKVYYTTRELTVNLPELWPFISLGGEVIYPGPGAVTKTVTNPGGPDPWLKETLRGRKYIPAWVAHFTEGKYAGMQDLSVITTPDSRLNNFYVSGLDWMVQHLKIDGIYIDDCSLDRATLRRVRKILDDNRKDANIDMHSWNHFNEYAGWASCLNLYMDLFPYVDQLWIGEGRNYDTPSDYWLVEISGIPFSIPSQMLQDGGNPWRGMVYGMTNRAGWTGTSPDPIWRFWDKYDIKDKTMIGYWDRNNPITVDNDSIKATLYRGAKESVISIANFGNTDQVCSLHIDFQKMGYTQSTGNFFIPAIEGFQNAEQLNSLDHLFIRGGKGFLLVLNTKD